MEYLLKDLIKLPLQDRLAIIEARYEQQREEALHESEMLHSEGIYGLEALAANDHPAI